MILKSLRIALCSWDLESPLLLYSLTISAVNIKYSKSHGFWKYTIYFTVAWDSWQIAASCNFLSFWHESYQGSWRLLSCLVSNSALCQGKAKSLKLQNYQPSIWYHVTPIMQEWENHGEKGRISGKNLINIRVHIIMMMFGDLAPFLSVWKVNYNKRTKHNILKYTYKLCKTNIPQLKTTKPPKYHDLSPYTTKA